VGTERDGKVSWKDKKTNEETLALAGEEGVFCEISNEEENEQDKTYLLDGNLCLLKIVTHGRMVGRKPRRRRRMGMIDDLQEGYNAEMERRIEDREKRR
jgi:hypothetical protein